MKLLSAIKNGLDWSSGVKIIMIVATAALLCVVVALLAAEIAGKKKRRVIHERAEPLPDEGFEDAVPHVKLPERQTEHVAEETAVAEESEDEFAHEKEIELTEDAVLVDDGGDTGRMVIGETQFKVRYNRSFTAKLIQSDDLLKSRYSELKNELMRYKLKPRMSWSNESFYKGRATYAKFAIRGKTLSLYLALQPSEYAETKYIFEDASEVSKYANTPMRLKLKSVRSVRWAKELIARLAKKSALQKTEIEEENFRPEYEEPAPLVAIKLIKLYYGGIYPAPVTRETAEQPPEEQPAERVEEPADEFEEELAEEAETPSER